MFNTNTIQVSGKRFCTSLLLIICLLGLFWGLSRYPDLLSEYDKAHYITERSLGNLSKDQMVNSQVESSHIKAVLLTMLNWLDTNKIGMSFGIFFGSAILLLLEQLPLVFNYLSRGGLRGVFSGLFLGVPLGVCTNCATPVSLGLARAGASLEAAFATLICSPSLNPIGLLIILLILPQELFWIRLLCMGVVIFFCIPFFTRIFKLGTKNTITEKTLIEETWRLAVQQTAKRYVQHLAYILSKVLLPMLVIGLIASVMVTFYPIEKFALLYEDRFEWIVFASCLGALLPMPMFVDIILVKMLLELNVSIAIAASLIVTLAPTSLYATYVMARHASWKMSLSLFISVMILGIGAGTATKMLQVQQDHVDRATSTLRLSSQIKTDAVFDNKKIDNFFSGGLSFVDFDQDGDDDLFISGRSSAKLYQNDGKGKFTDITSLSGISQKYNTVAGIWGDYNNDGLPDLLMVNYADEQGRAEPNFLYQNLGQGRFKNISLKVNLMHKDFSSSASWVDFDRDGDLDLFVSNYGKLQLDRKEKIRGSSGYDRLYRNDSGAFKEIANIAGVRGKQVTAVTVEEIETNRKKGDRGFSFQSIWFDYNKDGWPDLFVASDFGVSQLYQNLGNGRFKNVTYQSGLDQFTTGMGVAILDVDQNGYDDIYLTTTEGNKLWLNQGHGLFTENARLFQLSDRAKVGWGVIAADLSNQGKQDIVIANGPIINNRGRVSIYEETMLDIMGINSIFSQEKENIFSVTSRNYDFFNKQISRGMVMSDIDNDGDVDIAVLNRSGAQVELYENISSAKNHYLKLKLKGKQSNRFAIGAIVTLHSAKGMQRRVLTAGSSFASQNSQVLHFGLGSLAVIDKIEILWPSGQIKILKDVAVDQTLIVEE